MKRVLVSISLSLSLPRRKLEDYETDVRYFALKAGLGGKIRVNSRSNSSSNNKTSSSSSSSDSSRQNELWFWSSVPAWLREDLAEAYSADLDMFGYDAGGYLRELDIHGQQRATSLSRKC